MNKYTLLSIFDITSTIFAIAIVLISAIFNNYWLLFLLLFAGVSSETRDMILKSK